MKNQEKNVNKKHTFNIDVEQKERLIEATIKIISLSKTYIQWFNFVDYIIDNYAKKAIQDMTYKVKINSGKGRSTYKISAERRDKLVDISKHISNKLNTSVSWSNVLTFIIDHYINDAIDNFNIKLFEQNT